MEPVANQANAKSNAETESAAWLIVAAAALRTAFGILLAIDAYLKWQPGFAAHYVGYLQNAANGQPHWLEPWFHMWLRLVTMHTAFFISATRLIETAIAIGLLLGLARRITYFAGALFSLLIWSTAEGFGGPYTSGATNVGPALVYALVFIAAALFEHLLGPNPYSLDYYIERRLSPVGITCGMGAETFRTAASGTGLGPTARRDRRDHRHPCLCVIHARQRENWLATDSAKCRRRSLAAEHYLGRASCTRFFAGAAATHRERQRCCSDHRVERRDH